MTNIDFSFIIPHKDTYDLLLRCLDSIPQRENIQVIVVDDNSEAEIKVKLKQLPQTYPNLTLVELDESHGGGYARNQGIKHIRGKWTLFTDSDDFYCKEVDVFLNKYLDSDAEVIYFKAKTINEDLTPSSQTVLMNYFIDLYLKNATDISDVKFGSWEPWNKMIKSSLFVYKHDIRFDEVSAKNDAMFSLKIGKVAKRIIVTDDVLYNYVQRANSVVHRTTYDRVLSRFLVTFRQNNLYRDVNYKRKVFLINHFWIFRKYIDSNILKLYLNYLIQNKTTPFEGFVSYFIFNIYRKLVSK